MSTFLNRLRNYFLKILQEEADTYLIKNRLKFAQECLKSIENRNAIAITNLLSEENIKEFKNFFGRRFYDILRSFQDYPWKRSVAVANAMSSMPALIVHLVNQYEPFFYNNPMEYTKAERQKNKLNTLPGVAVSSIASFLNGDDKNSLVSSARAVYGFLQPHRIHTYLLDL